MNRREVMALTGLGSTTIWRHEGTGGFPARVQLSPGRMEAFRGHGLDCFARLVVYFSCGVLRGIAAFFMFVITKYRCIALPVQVYQQQDRQTDVFLADRLEDT